MENPYEPTATTNFHSNEGADSAVRRGKVIVIVVITFTIAFSLTTIVLFNLVLGPRRLSSQVVRFGLNLGLAVCLYNGLSWARYVMAVLLAIAAVFGFVSLLQSLDKLNWITLALFVGMIVGYAASAVALVAFPSVSRFLLHQRSRK